MGKRKADPEEAQEEGAGLSTYERERQLLCETYVTAITHLLCSFLHPPPLFLLRTYAAAELAAQVALARLRRSPCTHAVHMCAGSRGTAPASSCWAFLLPSPT